MFLSVQISQHATNQFIDLATRHWLTCAMPLAFKRQFPESSKRTSWPTIMNDILPEMERRHFREMTRSDMRQMAENKWMHLNDKKAEVLSIYVSCQSCVEKV
jgi:hypothetical protein